MVRPQKPTPNPDLRETGRRLQGGGKIKASGTSKNGPTRSGKRKKAKPMPARATRPPAIFRREHGSNSAKVKKERPKRRNGQAPARESSSSRTPGKARMPDETVKISRSTTTTTSMSRASKRKPKGSPTMRRAESLSTRKTTRIARPSLQLFRRGFGLPPLERTRLPYATLAFSILSSSKSVGLL